MTEHYCHEHKTPWFKKGKMRGYAHPIGDTGGWCNEPEEDDVPEAVKEVAKTATMATSATQVVEAKMSREDWAEKDKITRKSIERQTALNAAVKVSELVQKGGDDSTTSKIISTAKRFELYLETGIDVAAQVKQQEVTGAKSQLVQAAKAMGAKVIAEGQKAEST